MANISTEYVFHITQQENVKSDFLKNMKLQ